MVSCFISFFHWSELFLGAFIGLMVTLMYKYTVKYLKNKNLSKKFLPYGSNKDDFDWVCYDITGRNRKKNPNGSIANLKYLGKRKFQVTVWEKALGGGKWVGNIIMADEKRGELTFKYEGQLEYGFKHLFIGINKENGKTYQYIYLIGDGKLYGNELIMKEITK